MRVGAIGVDHLPLACMTCGSRHHVRAGVSRHTATSVAYCVRCLGTSGVDTARVVRPANDPS
jgi:hypothetical protein